MITRRWAYRAGLGLGLSLSAGCDNGLDLGSTEATGAGASSTSNASSGSSNATGSGMATGTGGASGGTTATGTGGASSGTTATGTGGAATTSSGSTGTGMCQDTCTPNAEQCSGAQVQQCKTQADGCYGWSSPMACPVNQTCLGTQCALACADQCVAGAKQCNAGKSETCAKQANGCTDWGASQACPAGQTCSGGACVPSCTDQCAAGAVQCSGPKTQTCAKQANGCTDWSAAQDCPAGNSCSGGQCVLACTNQCTAGAVQCSGSQVQTCSQQVSGCTGWNPASDCPANQTCSGGQCVLACTNQCTTGSTQCVGADIQSCALQASGCTGWSAAQSCTSGQSCSGGMCPAVKPGVLAAGFGHTCALTSSGGVKCWGYNGFGQLGNNSTVNSDVPVNVQGFFSGVTALAAGSMHTCALTSSGGVKCWGNNYSGQLGNNSTTKSPVPVDVQGLSSGVTALASGWMHTCALMSTGGVKCWGDNYAGQLGNNSTTKSLVPVDVQGLPSGLTALAAGSGHTCVLLSFGGGKCWGWNNSGQLGNNSTTNSPLPTSLQGLDFGATALTTREDHTCALMQTGGVKCWGSNNKGQLGNNSTTDSPIPLYVQGLTSGVTAFAAGSHHTCALRSSGGVKCWGDNGFGNLGNNLTVDSPVPIDVQGLSSGVVALATGSQHTCALTSSGGLKCWGRNDFGQLGNSSTTNSSVPVNAFWP